MRSGRGASQTYDPRQGAVGAKRTDAASCKPTVMEVVKLTRMYGTCSDCGIGFFPWMSSWNCWVED